MIIFILKYCISIISAKNICFFYYFLVNRCASWLDQVKISMLKIQSRPAGKGLFLWLLLDLFEFFKRKLAFCKMPCILLFANWNGIDCMNSWYEIIYCFAVKRQNKSQTKAVQFQKKTNNNNNNFDYLLLFLLFLVIGFLSLRIPNEQGSNWNKIMIESNRS